MGSPALLGGGEPWRYGSLLHEDSFTTDRLAEYTLSRPVYAVAGGLLAVASDIMPTTAVVTAHALLDGAVTVQHGETDNHTRVAAVLAWLDADNYLAAYRSGSNLLLRKRDAALTSTLATVAWTFAAGRYVRFSRAGNELRVTGHAGDPHTTAADVSGGHTLEGANATKFGAGVAGRLGAGSFQVLGFEVAASRLRIETA